MYESALAIELRAQRVPFRTQVPIPMLYRGESVGNFFADFIVDRRVILELTTAHPFKWTAASFDKVMSQADGWRPRERHWTADLTAAA